MNVEYTINLNFNGGSVYSWLNNLGMSTEIIKRCLSFWQCGFFNQSGSVWMSGHPRAWPSRLMREKGDVSMMYSYLLIESSMAEQVKRSHLLCLPICYSPRFCPIIQYWEISPVNTVPSKLKIESFVGVFFCYLSFLSSIKVKLRNRLLLDMKCYLSRYVVLILVLHRLPKKMLSLISLRHRALIVEEKSSNSVSNSVRGLFVPHNN